MTKAETRQLLQENGFVRVDGLTARGPGENEEEVLSVDTHYPRGGRWDFNNGIYVVFTEYRELWIRSADRNGGLELVASLEMLAPNGRGMWVPCSNGEWPSAYHLLCRVANPDFDPSTH